jgi:succinate-semialdehyde dehydrogenase/glutarate-semialdehyde dehydrogenase
MVFRSINPYTEEVNWTYDSFSIGECRAQIEKSRAAFLTWSSLSAEERAKYFEDVAGVLRQNTDTYAEIITTEMGKPIRQSKDEIQKCARLCDYYAENAAELLKDEVVDIGSEKSYVTFEPLGVIFGIMPWNSLSGRFSGLQCL